MISIIEFVLGIAVLVYSAEKLIAHLVGVASRWAISLFLIAVVFTGIEFDDLAFGIVLNVEDLSQVALGTVIGTTVAMTGIVLALAAIIAPCPSATSRSPTSCCSSLAPVVMYALAATGALTLVTGVVLVVLFVAFVGWIAYREYAARRPVWRNAESTSSSRRSARARRRSGHRDPDPRRRRGRGRADGTRRQWSGGGGRAASTCRPTCASTRASCGPGRTHPGPASPTRSSRCVGLVIGAVVAGAGHRRHPRHLRHRRHRLRRHDRDAGALARGHLPHRGAPAPRRAGDRRSRTSSAASCSR